MQMSEGKLISVSMDNTVRTTTVDDEKLGAWHVKSFFFNVHLVILFAITQRAIFRGSMLKRLIFSSSSPTCLSPVHEHALCCPPWQSPGRIGLGPMLSCHDFADVHLCCIGSSASVASNPTGVAAGSGAFHPASRLVHVVAH